MVLERVRQVRPTARTDRVTVVGFHASHEQIPPSQLLADVQAAEQAGFDAAMCSDHIAPWSERQGHAGFAFAHEQWRTNVFSPPVPWDLETPRHFDVVAQEVTEKQLRGAALISSEPGQHAEWLNTSSRWASTRLPELRSAT